MSGTAGVPFPLEQAPRRKLAETVAQQLIEAIRDQAPGARLPSEKELTQMLGVGRSTVREALNGLALLGIIEIRHGQGVFVVERVAAETPSEEAGTIARALAKGVTRDLLEARQIVEVAIARLAAQRRTDAEIREIEAVLESHQRTLQAGREPTRDASQFHVLLAQAAHNEVLSGVFQSFFKLMTERGPRLYEQLKGFREWELDQHQHLYEAIRDGDESRAAELMYAHIAAMEHRYKEAGTA